MNKCIICSKETKLYKKINTVIISECADCKLAVTNNSPKTKNLYNNTVYNLDHYLSLKKSQHNKFQDIANNINHIIDRGDILEVGGGFGLFSSILANNTKYHIEVVEPHLSLHFIQNNRNIIKHKKTYEEFLKSNKKKYDCVILLDVLEHFPHPDVILKQTKNILTEKGFIALQFPNYTSLMARICENWSWWMIEDHKFHFSPRSSKLLLNKEDFKIVYSRTYEGMYDLKKNLDGNFCKEEKIKKIIFFVLFFPLYSVIRKLLWHFGFGGLIFLIAEKK